MPMTPKEARQAFENSKREEYSKFFDTIDRRMREEGARTFSVHFSNLNKYEIYEVIRDVYNRYNWNVEFSASDHDPENGDWVKEEGAFLKFYPEDNNAD
jgi:hypothetical protein